MDVYKKALEIHKEHTGKLTTKLKAPLNGREDLSLLYTPGVAAPCREIEKDPSLVYNYTWKGNLVAVITDGSAVLGLGNIGPLAGLPVMEGKCVLFKRFADIDAVPILLDTQDTEEIIETIKNIAPSFGGINLEDISAPRCVEIETRLKEELKIPVFHDDQHGTAIVLAAALINSMKLIGKEMSEVVVTISGTGAAGSSIIKMLNMLGVQNIYAFNIDGMVQKDCSTDFLLKEIAEITNKDAEVLSMKEAFAKSDVFIGVSAPGIVSKEMVSSMKKDAVVFAMANPEPEITYKDAKEAGARVVGTGRSDYPNQVNNVLAFPGIFKGALAVRADKITEEMKLAAARAIAAIIPEEELTDENVIPGVFHEGVAQAVASSVKECYLRSKDSQSRK